MDMSTQFNIGDPVCYLNNGVQRRGEIIGYRIKVKDQPNINERLKIWNEEFEFEYLVNDNNSFPFFKESLRQLKLGSHLLHRRWHNPEQFERAEGFNAYPDFQPKYLIGDRVLCEFKAKWYRAKIIGILKDNNNNSYDVWYMNWPECPNNPTTAFENELKKDFCKQSYESTGQNPVEYELPENVLPVEFDNFFTTLF